MKRMLFNATHAEELRVALVDGQQLVDLDIESAVRSEKKGNIYKGKVTKVEPSLEACFVDYGTKKQGFLPFKEIYRDYFQNYDSKTSIANVKINSVIKEGQEMVVQVDKDERGTKGAALTTFISLAGRFLVFMPNNPKGGGISRRIAGEDRAELRQLLANLDVDSRHSLIARTEGIGRTQDELQWDLNFLMKTWEVIEQESAKLKAPFLIYQESNLIVRAIRDHLSADVSEIIVDDPEVHERAHRFILQVMPHNAKKLKLYQDGIPLFSRYQIESQISSAFLREVGLRSGGSITIDHTEALISIDVNSGRATKGADIEETALHTNLEAVEEVARQLRIRDLGGLIVIDLIDMSVHKNQQAVQSRFKGALRADRARVQTGPISRFGLLEMSRQRLRASISEANYRQCPRCEGTGTIRSVVSSSLNLLRLIEEEALKENTEAVQVTLPLDMATYLLNEKRYELSQLETRLASRIIIIPSDELDSPHYQVKRLSSNELDELTGVSSFEQKVDIENTRSNVTASLKMNRPEKASIELDQIGHEAPPASLRSKASAEPAESPGLIKRLTTVLFGSPSNTDPAAGSVEPAPAARSKRKTPQKGTDRPDRQPSRHRTKKATAKKRGTGKGGAQGAPKKQSPRPRPDGRTPRQGKSQPGNPKHQRKKATTRKPGTSRNTAGVKPAKSPGKTAAHGKGRHLGPTETNDLIHQRQGNRSAKPKSPKSGGKSQKGFGSSVNSMGGVTAMPEIPKDLPDDIGNRKN
ncbi:MAG: Rne/Rng family ribonuclease [Gammaproteobacteria bacterium]|nr:Rne/Rng family ribonuclease [Gammaproteobacteria bacterium]